jgi:hypothetical protein
MLLGSPLVLGASACIRANQEMTVDRRKEHISLRERADLILDEMVEHKSQTQSALVESIDETLSEVGKSIQLSIYETNVDVCRLYQQEALRLLETARAYVGELQQLTHVKPEHHLEPWALIQIARKKADDTFSNYGDFENITIVSRGR